MLEIRYRVVNPGVPIPFAPWFRQVPEGRVHCTQMRFSEDASSAVFVAMGGDDTERLASDVAAMPTPNATLWERMDGKHGLAFFRAAWKEPIFADVRSPMHIAWSIYRDSALCSCTIRRDSVVQRILLPRHSETAHLWPTLRDEMLRYAGFIQAHARMDLERIGRISWGHEVPLDMWPASFRPAFEVGRFDEPPSASLEEVARLVGVPERTVLAELGELER